MSSRWGVVRSLDATKVVSAAFGWGSGELISTHILCKEILLVVVLRLHLTDHVLGELVLNAASLNLGNLVVRVGTLDLIGPLHLFSLNDETACLSLTVFSWGK